MSQGPGVAIKRQLFEVLGVNVMFIESEVGFSIVEKFIDTKISIKNVSESLDYHMSIEDFDLNDIIHLFILNQAHQALYYQSKPISLKELIFEACKIYSHIVENHSNPKISKVFESLYITKVNFYKDNYISLSVEQIDNTK